MLNKKFIIIAHINIIIAIIFVVLSFISDNIVSIILSLNSIFLSFILIDTIYDYNDLIDILMEEVNEQYNILK